ncbi:fatty acid desaturase family protein [Glaciecola sp. SC05]|uniref:fatty acid desaturase family protein n=1 Tax=Glaciecola sp. SC05 TaxID=1987355 RepID=UPI00352823EE
MLSIWPNPITFIVAISLIGARQLGLAILLHDCAHFALFSKPNLNNFIGHYICGSVVNQSVFQYREYHTKHHIHTGTANDPDLSLVAAYPVKANSLKRKLLRDITGITGVKFLVNDIRSFKATNLRWVVFHLLLLSLFIVIGQVWLYAVWWASTLFIYPLVARLRHIGEHGTVTQRGAKDVRLNTNTTIVPFWQRCLIAPNYVNYHTEHHLSPGIPPYRLAEMHKLLSERGFYDGQGCIRRGYGEVLKHAVVK